MGQGSEQVSEFSLAALYQPHGLACILESRILETGMQFVKVEKKRHQLLFLMYGCFVGKDPAG